MNDTTEENKKRIAKQKIFYARTYRYLARDRFASVLYLLLLVLPCFILLLLFYGRLSVFVADTAARALQYALPGAAISFAEVDFIPFLSPLKIVVMPTTYPTPAFTGANLAASFALLYLCLRGKGKSRPVGIFLGIMLFVHIVNCVYFVFAADSFPYRLADYSGLYMEQQIGIWLSFLVIIGLVTGLLGYKAWLWRIATFFGVMLYSFAFGLLRYILALYVVYRFSVIYIAAFFFALGPFFDFLYLVCLYGFFSNKMTRLYSGEKGMEEWKWS